MARIVLIALMAALLLPSTASATSIYTFRTPDKAAYCTLYSGYKTSGGIEQGFHEGRATDAGFECWTPNDGFTVTMNNSGRVVSKTYDPNAIGFTPHAPVLRFGQMMHRHRLACKSRSTGITCANHSRHGWWLGRYTGYSIH